MECPAFPRGGDAQRWRQVFVVGGQLSTGVTRLYLAG
jgi:hypothetical protein